MIQTGDLLSRTPTHILFECPVASPELEVWLKRLPPKPFVVSIACGSPGPSETQDVSLLVGRPLTYIGLDNDPKKIELARSSIPYFKEHSPHPLSISFELLDLLEPLPKYLRQIADAVLFIAPEAGYDDEAVSPVWKTIIGHGLDALKPRGLVITSTLFVLELVTMTRYLRDFGVRQIAYAENTHESKTLNPGVLLGLKP